MPTSNGWQDGKSDQKASSLSSLSVEIFLVYLNDVKGEVWMPLVATIEEECFPWSVIRCQRLQWPLYNQKVFCVSRAAQCQLCEELV